MMSVRGDIEGFPATSGAWCRLCRRASELLGTPSKPAGWDPSPSGPPAEVVCATMWGWLRARFLGSTLVGLSWEEGSCVAQGSWPTPWKIGWVDGTPFQRAVWSACLDATAVTSYGDLAAAIGHLGAARAVGGALGANPLGPLVPCHWPGRGDGSLGGFRWGPERKAAWRIWEQAVRVGGPVG